MAVTPVGPRGQTIRPVPWFRSKSREAEVTNPMRAGQARESQVSGRFVNTLGCRHIGQLAADVDEAREGSSLRKEWPQNVSSSLGGEESQGGIRLGQSANPWLFRRDCGGELNPEAEAALPFTSLLVDPWRFANCMRAAAFERTYDSIVGSTPRRENPMDGFGMKQAR